MTSENAPQETNPKLRFGKAFLRWASFYSPEHLVLVAVFLVGVLLLFYNFDNYYLWGDEGETAFLGKNTLKYGLPYAFDGRNLYEFRNGYALNSQFLLPLSPWLQYYVTALSFLFWGFTTFASRLPFVIAGAIGPLIQYCFVRHYFHDRKLALITMTVMYTSVSYLLFSRQCRYYAIVMLFSALVALLYSRFEGRRIEIILTYPLFMLFMASNYLVAAPFMTAMAMAFFLFDDKKKAYRFFFWPLTTAVLVEVGIILWLFSVGGPNNPEVLRNIGPIHFLKVTWLYLKDYNFNQLLPLGIFIVLILHWLVSWRTGKHSESAKIRKEMAVVATVFFFTVILAMLSPESSGDAHANIRYATVAFPFLFLIQGFAIVKTIRWKAWVGYALLTVTLCSNLMTFNPFRSLLYEYVLENYRPFPNAVKAAVTFLETRVGQDDLVLVSPNHMIGPMEFYLGDKVLLCNVIDEQNKNLLAAGVTLPRYIYGDDTIPQWVVLFGLDVDMPHTWRKLKSLDIKQYKIHVLPILGVDLSRPEIFARAFVPITGYRGSLGLFVLEWRGY